MKCKIQSAIKAEALGLDPGKQKSATIINLVKWAMRRILHWPGGD